MSAAGRIVNDANDLKRDSRKLAQDLGDAAGDEAEGRSAEVERLLARIEAMVTSVYETVTDRGARSIETVEEVVEENPWMSVLAAFAAGALAGLLLSRR
ncbi:MAG: glycine zipper domain-containing protein [Rhizomicrobium sp.]